MYMRVAFADITGSVFRELRGLNKPYTCNDIDVRSYAIQ